MQSSNSHRSGTDHSAREVLVEVILVNFGPFDTAPGKFETAFSFWENSVFSNQTTLENVDELGLCLRKAGGKSYIIVVDLIAFEQLRFRSIFHPPSTKNAKRKASVFKSPRFDEHFRKLRFRDE